MANLSITLVTPFVFSFVVPNNGITYTQLGFTFGGMPIFSTLTLTDVLATSNSSIRACQANVKNIPTFTEAPSSVDADSPNHVCIFDAADQVFYNAPAIGQCFCDKNAAGAACDVPALPLPFTPGRTILKAACGGFSSNQGLALARDGSLQPVQVDGAYLDGGAYECKCRDLGLVMRGSFRLDSPFSDLNIYRSDAEYGQPQFTDALESGTPMSQVSNLCANRGATLPAIVFPQDGQNWLAAWRGNVVVSGLTMVSQGVFQWGQTQFLTSPRNVTTPCPNTTICALINYNDLAYGQAGGFTDGVFTALAPTPSPLFIPLSYPTGNVAQWTIQFWPNSGSPDLTIRAGSGCVGAGANAAGFGYITCSGNVTNVTLSNSAILSLSEVQVYVDAARV